MAIVLFFRKNPKVIAFIFIIGILLAGIIYLNSIFNQNKAYKIEIINLKVDTTYKVNEIIKLRYEVAFYKEKLDEVRHEIDSIKSADSKQNPGLSDKYPSINDLKKQRK